jgi:sugar O-acyltransferase (sialic acid O-acetyltransferase NeuD family)
MKNVALIGAGGLAYEVISFLEKSYRYNVEYLYDSTIKEDIKKNGYLISNKFKSDIPHFIAVGYPETKQKIIKSIKEHLKLASPFIHSLGAQGKDVYIGDGSVIYPMVTLTSNISIKQMATINSNSLIGHDCKIGEMFHASTGAAVSGNVTIGDRVFLGANSCIKEKISICSDVIIGAGGVVIRDITNPGVYAGNPVRKL